MKRTGPESAISATRPGKTPYTFNFDVTIEKSPTTRPGIPMPSVHNRDPAATESLETAPESSPRLAAGTHTRVQQLNYTALSKHEPQPSAPEKRAASKLDHYLINTVRHDFHGRSITEEITDSSEDSEAAVFSAPDTTEPETDPPHSSNSSSRQLRSQAAANARWNSQVVEERIDVTATVSEWPSFCSWLAQAKQVRTVSISNGMQEPAAVQALATALAGKASFTELVLQHCGIRSEGVRALCTALKFNFLISALDLGGNELKDADAAEIARVLEGNPTLKKLNLRHNDIGTPGLQAIANSLLSNHSLVELDLGYNNMSSIALLEFGKLLQQNASLATLTLDYPSRLPHAFQVTAVIDEEAAEIWAEAMRTNKTLAELKLSGIWFLYSALETFAEGLAANSTLRSLDLIACRLDSIDAQALARALRRHSSLERLDLSINQIEAEGGEALAEMLGSNTALKNLYLAQNRMRCRGVAAIANAMKRNTTLIQLNVELNHVDRGALTGIADALEDNHTLQSCDIREDSFIYGSEKLWLQRERIEQTMRRNQAST